MKSNSLGRLQTEIIKLEQENLKLKDKLEEAQKKNKLLEQKIKYLENNVEQKVKVAVEKLVKDILIENEELKAENAKLKKILNTDSSNSGIPTSKTKIGETKRIPNSREKSNKTKGGQEGHKKHKLEKFKDEEITDTYTYEIANPICKCGGKLKLTGKRYKDEFDIEIRLIKRRNEFCEYECVKCGREIKVPIPNNLKEENQYGSNVQAIALSLVNEGCVSFKRTRELICGFSGGEMNISEGYLVKLQKRSYDNLEAFEKEMYQKILKQKLIYWDDTVITINGKQSCLRFYGNEQIKYYKSHETKSKDGLDNDGILKYLSEDWLFSDVGTIPKNFCNYGFDDKGNLLILDYGYFYKKDPKILFCESDGGSLVYDENFDQLRCTSCGRKYNVVDIKYRMDISEEEYEKQRNKNIKGPLVIGFRGVNVGADGKAYAMKKGK